MSVLFGATGGAVPPGHEPYSTTLRHYPGVGAVGRYLDPDYFVTLGRPAVRPGTAGPDRCGGDRYVLALEGWLANRAELARSLDLGTDPPTDRGIVAAALLRWGRDALVRLHGDFVLAWWDRIDRRLLLATDRTGGRALFYHEAAGRLFFANLTAPLFMHPDVPRRLDPAMVARAAVTPLLDLEHGCFQGINQLLPGHLLDWTAAAGARVARYWRLDPTRRLRLRRDQDYVEAARELLDQVVHEALPQEGIAASMLSGGLDSGGVAATIARLTTPAPLHTITLRPDPTSPLPTSSPRQFQDEWPYAQATARLHPSIIAHGVPAQLPPLAEILRSSFHWGGRPPVHLLAGAWMAAGWQRARQLGASTVFVGRAGNATLSSTCLPNMLIPALRDLPQALYGTILAASVGKRVPAYLRLFAPIWLREWRDRWQQRAPEWQRWTGLATAAAKNLEIIDLLRAYRLGDRTVPWHRRARLRHIERSWMSRTLSSCQHFRDGVERRDPLGDVRLAEFCLSLPADQFTRFGQDRFLARRVLADRLPPMVITERRDGRQGAEWFDWASRSRDWLAAEVEGIAASSLGRTVIDVPRLRAILDDWPPDADAAEPRYRQLMNVMGRGVAIGSFIRWAEGHNQ